MQHSSVKRKVILDTDVGLDDCETIIYLTACKDIELLAITLVSGNSCMPTISKNAKRILAYLKKESIPLYEAGSFNLLGNYIVSDGYFGENAFAGIELPETDLESVKGVYSCEALINFVRKYPNEVSIVCVGSLTNLALACIIDNEFPTLVGSIVIMGCDKSPQTTGNVTPHAEFNAYTDPVSYNIVSNMFKNAKQPITVIDFTFCQKNLLRNSLFTRLYKDGKFKNKHVELMSIIRDFTNEIISRSLHMDGFLTCDSFAACGWHDPSIFKKKRRVSLKSIELTGEKRGHTIFEDDDNGPFELIDEVDIDKMEENIINTLIGAS